MPERERVAWKPIPGIDRAEAQRAFAPIDGALRVAAPAKHDAAENIRQGRGRTDRQRGFERDERSSTIMAIHADGKAGERQGARSSRPCAMAASACRTEARRSSSRSPPRRKRQ